MSWGWRSKQLQRVVHSSLGAEALSLLELFGDLHYAKLTLQQMYGKALRRLPTIAVTDSKNLFQAVHNIKTVEDRRLISTIAELKKAMVKDRMVDKLRHLGGEFMLADGLTKKGASSEKLLGLLQTGHYTLPGGWELSARSRDMLGSWMHMDLNKGVEGIKLSSFSFSTLRTRDLKTRICIIMGKSAQG